MGPPRRGLGLLFQTCHVTDGLLDQLSQDRDVDVVKTLDVQTRLAGRVFAERLQERVVLFEARHDVESKVLQAFINQVSGLIDAGVLTEAEGQPLIDAAQSVIDALNAG